MKNEFLKKIHKLFKKSTMKQYEKDLLNNLVGESSENNELLHNVKNAMGSLRNVQGNPLFTSEILLECNVYYIDNTFPSHEIAPALLPTILQQKYPIYLLGLTDFYGGYRAENMLVNNVSPWLFTTAYSIIGRDLMGFNPITAKLSIGDVIYGYNATVAGTTYTRIVRIHCNNVAYATFLNSFVSDLITLDSIRYSVPIANINQFINPLIFGYQTLFGKVFTDSINPRMYITNKDFQQNICDIPINVPIDKSLLLCLHSEFDSQTLNFQLFVKKVESLTGTLKNKLK